MLPENHDAQVKSLVSSALRYLSRRNRSTHEVSSYLFSKAKNDSELAALAMQRVSQFNLLNDAEFARNWTQMRLSQGKGPLLIIFELKSKGISPDLIHQTIGAITDELWFTSAQTALNRKHLNLQPAVSPAAKAKIYRYLKSRGFNSGTVYAVIDAVGAT
jgi:regulatory protein